MAVGLGNGPEVLAVLRERVESMGLLVWQCDAVGLVVDAPPMTGAGGLVLSGRVFAKAIADSATKWRTAERPPVTEVLPGTYMIPIPDVARGRRLGYLVVGVLEMTALESKAFLEACRAAGVGPEPAAASLLQYAHGTRTEAMHLADLLRSMHEDLGAGLKTERAIEGFTTELTVTYEQVSLLYELGRSMRGFPDPAEFLARTAANLQDATDFRWAAARPCGATAMPSLAGSPSIDVPRVIELFNTLEREAWDERAPRILTAVGGEPLPSGSQLLAQPVLIEGRLAGLILAGDRGGRDPQISSYDTNLFETAGTFVSTFLENHALAARERATFFGLVRALTAAIDAKDPYTRGHSERVAHLGRKLAEALGAAPEECERVHLSGLLHDVGKIGVPEAVLLKNGRLTDDEFEAIKKHPRTGHEILLAIPRFDDVLGGVLSHHERWDGRGYPEGLSGEQIPWIGRVLALADTFDAMSSNRAYRAALPRERVLEEVRNCSGAQFDPDMVPAFLSIDLTEYDAMTAVAQAQRQAA